MNKAIVLVIPFLFFACVTQPYNTFETRNRDYETSNISVAAIGLSEAQIKTILGTRFPKQGPVSLSVFYLIGNSYGSGEQALLQKTVKALMDLDYIDRVVPIPPFLMPATITFEAIQQLGIRSMSEYSLLFFGNTYNTASWKKLSDGKYLFNSIVDFILVDNETTAIIASDKLVSEIDVKIEVFSDEEIMKAKNELFDEQVAILIASMNRLFNK